MNMYILPQVSKKTSVDDISIQFQKDTDTDDVFICPSLRLFLTKMKNQIQPFVKEWDRYKKYINPYEYIHTAIPGQRSSICTLTPVSRAFFKFIEFENTFGILELFKKTSIRSFHIAEGPGGFIEALHYVRQKLSCSKHDVYSGITLESLSLLRNCNIPGWDRLKECNIPNLNIVCGTETVDLRGDILNPHNFRKCINEYRETIHLVTADGGFDFTIDFNNQERMATRLILAETFMALCIQKIDGNLILKIYDVFTSIMVDIIFLISTFYTKVFIFKPNTSRSANSEKYLVCIKKHTKVSEELQGSFESIIDALDKNGDRVSQLLTCEISNVYMTKLQDILMMIGHQQLESISHTINLIIGKKYDRIESIRKNNIMNCIEWCKKNNLPYREEGV